MINADLASDMSSSDYNSILDVWLNMHKYAGMPVKVDFFNRNVASLSTKKMESILKSSGFDSPLLFFQTLFILHNFYVIRFFRFLSACFIKLILI